MRSTVEIADILDRKLRRKAQELGLTFKEILNRTVAVGLASLESSSKINKKPFKVVAKRCGFKPGVDTLHLNRLADEIDDEEKFLRNRK